MKVGRRISGDDGTSLAEILVAIGVFAMLMVIVTGEVVGGQRAAGYDQSKLANTQSAQVAMDEMTRQLRTAGRTDVTASSAFVSPATASSTTFYDNTCGTPSKVSFTVSAANSLVETIIPASNTTPPYTWNTSAAQTRTLAPSLASTSVFTYLGADGSPLPFVSGSLTATTITQVAAVRIALSLGPADNRSSVTNVVSQVTLLNGGIIPPVTVTSPGAC